MPTLLLVDGSSYLYRAYHAMPDLRSREGAPTGAIYGVIGMLRRLHPAHNSGPGSNGGSGGKVTHVACVFDAKGKTFREDWYPEYKAHRPSMPDDLAMQIAPLHECIRALGWPLICQPGVEADDVIGTLTVQAVAAGYDVVIVTGDKDMAQLVGPQVKLLNTMNEEVLDEAGVLSKFGVPPSLIVDYLALIGDAVDNVPGVAKVGPKTALKWLTQYGSLDGVVAHAAEIGGAVGKNLQEALAFLPLGRKLLTICCDCSLPLRLDELLPTIPDKTKLAELYEALDFKTWRRDLDASERAPAAARPRGATSDLIDLIDEPAVPVVVDESGTHRSGYECILDWPHFERWLARLEQAPAVALLTKTSSSDPMTARLVGIGFATAPGEAAYLPLGHDYSAAPDQLPADAVLARLRPWLESSAPQKAGHDLKYEQHVFANHGIALSGIADDVMLMSYVLEAGNEGVGAHDLEGLAKRHLGLASITRVELCGKGAHEIAYGQVDLQKAAACAAEGADLALRLQQRFAERFAADDKLADVYRRIELPVRQVLFAMERTGVLVDAELLNRQSHEIGKKLLDLEQRAFDLAGQPFNLASPKQLAEILFGRLGLPVMKKTPSGGPSTDEAVLSELALDYPLPKLLLEHRSLSKLKGTYTDKLPRMVNPVSGRVHTSFSQSTAVTGRLASSEPNLQNIPVRSGEGRRIRQAFVAPPGACIVSADYSQIELRIMAHLSGDPGFLAAFASGEDIHRATAGEIFGVMPLEVGPDQRRVAKVINFGLIYGMSAFGLARELGLERSAANAYIERYFARYPGVARYMEETRLLARQRGYVETVFGRRLWLPEIRASQAMRRQAAERAAINAPMQGTAADLIKLAMIAVDAWLREKHMASRIVLQVHDELILEVPEGELPELRSELPRLMCSVAALKVPLLVEVGAAANWESAH
jgi:DNA polymerase I